MRLRFARAARFAAAATIPLLFAAAVPVADGTTYEFIMKTQSTQTGNKETVSMRGKGTFTGEDARIEIIDAASSAGGREAFGGKGTYFVVKNSGKEMLLVDPNQKQYMKWDIANMFAGMSKVVNAVGGLVKMKMSDIKIDAQDMGAGETIQGYATRHVRMVQNYTMTASVFGRSSKTRSETTTDYYFAPALKNLANPFVSNSQAMAMMSQMDMFNNPDYKNQMAAANAKMQHGVPLKTVTRAVNTDEKGKQETMLTTMEMVNFKSANVPASTFAIPAGYQLVEMPSFNTATAGNAGQSGAQNTGDAKSGDPSIVDEARTSAAEGAKEGVKEASKEVAKEAAKKKLKGIFKR